MHVYLETILPCSTRISSDILGKKKERKKEDNLFFFFETTTFNQMYLCLNQTATFFIKKTTT